MTLRILAQGVEELNIGALKKTRKKMELVNVLNQTSAIHSPHLLGWVPGKAEVHAPEGLVLHARLAKSAPFARVADSCQRRSGKISSAVFHTLH